MGLDYTRPSRPSRPLCPDGVACWYGFIPFIPTETVQWLVELDEDVPEISILLPVDKNTIFKML